MDWTSCKLSRLVKETSSDENKVKSILDVAERKLDDANSMADERYYGKITLFYDVLREILECIALRKGYKIYNHECYTAFLKEVMKNSNMGDRFDELRLIRNGLNYYGKTINFEEGIHILKKSEQAIKLIKEMLNETEKL
ncbi:hypothetical protein HY483_02455 [Candidatus Woesearchaeota archaeon]|nr:hypothetical protein [Candidatus Woesearchaeota archaeon]